MRYLCFCLILILWAANTQALVELVGIPDQKINEGELLVLTIQALSDQNKVQFTGVDLPEGSSLENYTKDSCDLTWRPNFHQASNYHIGIVADDGSNIDQMEIVIEVSDSNQPPPIPTDPLPQNGEKVVSPNFLDLSWVCPLVDDDGDLVEFRVKVWEKGIIDPIFTKKSGLNSCKLEQFLEVGDYQWQVIAIDEHGLLTEGPIWSFIDSQWFKINIPATDFALLIRRPGDYNFKWTDINIQSNGSLVLSFSEAYSEGPNGESIEIFYGLKQNGGDTIWQKSPFSLNIELPKQETKIELFAKVRITPQNSAGDYKGVLRMNVSMKN